MICTRRLELYTMTIRPRPPLFAITDDAIAIIVECATYLSNQTTICANGHPTYILFSQRGNRLSSSGSCGSHTNFYPSRRPLCYTALFLMLLAPFSIGIGYAQNEVHDDG